MIQVKYIQRPDGDWRYRCGHASGRDWHAIGCQHIGPREANKHADTFRAPVEGSPAASVPPSGEAGVEPSTGVLNADRRG